MARNLVVKILGDASSLSKAFGQSAKSAETFGARMQTAGKGMQSFGKSMSLFVTAPLVAFGAVSVRAAVDAEQAMAMVNQAFKNAGIPVAEYTAAIKKAGEQAVQLGFDDETAAQSLARFATATGSTKKSMELLTVAEDLARFKGIDLSAATQIMTSAAGGNTRAIKQMGIAYIPTTTNVDKLRAAHKASKTAITAAELATAKLADKQENFGSIVDIVGKKVRGQGKAFSETAAGGMARFHEKLKNLEERIGKLLLPILDKLVGYLERLVSWFDGLSANTQKWILVTSGAVAALGPVVGILGTLARAIEGVSRAAVFLATNPIVLLLGAIAILGGAMLAATFAPKQFQAILEKFGVSAGTAAAAIKGLQTAFQVFSAIINTALFPFRTAFETLFLSIQAIVRGVAALIRGDWSAAWQAFKDLALAPVKALWAGLTAIVPNLGGLFSKAWSTIKTEAAAAWASVKSIVTTVWNYLVGAARTAVNLIAAPFKTGWEAVKTAATTVWGGIKTALTTIWNGLQAGAIKAALAIIEPFTHIPTSILGHDIPGTGWVKKLQELKKSLSAEMDKLKGEGTKGGKATVDALGKAISKTGQTVAAAAKHPAVIKKLATPFYNAGSTSGAQVGLGVAAGIYSNIGAAVAAAAALNSAVKAQLSTKFGSTPEQWAKANVGDPLIRGIALAILSGAPQVEGAAKKLKQRLAAVMQASDIAAMARQAGQLLGAGTVQGIINGVIGKTPSLKEQIRRAIVDSLTAAVATARTAYETAFGSLADAATAAFNAKLAAWKSPSQILLDKLALAKTLSEIGDTLGPAAETLMEKIGAALAAGNPKLAAKLEAQLNATIAAALATANTTLATAQANLAAAQATGDPDAIAKAQEAVTAAQTNLDAITTAQQTALTLLATQETAAHDKKVIADQTRFAKDLAALNTALGDQHKSVREKHALLLAFLDREGLGGKVAAELRGKLKAVENAADDLATAIKNRLSFTTTVTVNVETKNSPPGKALGGAVAKGMPYIVGEKGPEMFVPSMGGSIIPNRALRSTAAAGAGGGTIIVPVYLNGHEIARATVDPLRQLLTQKALRNR